MTTHALTRAVRPESKHLWSERYTLATSELHGTPDTQEARRLFELRQRGEEERPFERAAKQVGDYLALKFADVFASLDTADLTTEISAPDVANYFEKGLVVLQNNHDDGWKNWTIHRSLDHYSLHVEKANKQIVVGMSGGAIRADSLKTLFSHEALVHALRTINGNKYHGLLGGGLPGYMATEEGLGIFIEYALSGKIPERSLDRYLDIAYALGQIDGKQHPRSELLHLGLGRAMERNLQLPNPLPLATIKEDVLTHVNRIYKGSLGNEYIGINTKDAIYHAGFMKIGGYITEQLQNGTSIEAIVEFLLLGKFDPTNEAHVEFVREYAMK